MDDKINIVKEWLDFAYRDISSAKYLLNMRPTPMEIICYHCEQAVEKLLKGYLIYQNVEPPRTHVLKLLCKMCEDADETFKEISEQCGNLTIYGVQSRYPYEIDITEYDMKRAIIDADFIMKFVLMRIPKEKGYIATIPALGCIGDGETVQSAIDDVYEVGKEWLRIAQEEGRAVPKPELSRDELVYSGKFTVRVPKTLHKQLVMQASSEGISLNQLINDYIAMGLGHKMA